MDDVTIRPEVIFNRLNRSVVRPNIIRDPVSAMQGHKDPLPPEFTKYAPRRAGNNMDESVSGGSKMPTTVDAVPSDKDSAGDVGVNNALEFKNPNFKRLSDGILLSTQALRQLTQRTEAIAKESENAVLALRNDLEVERQKVEKLEAELEASKAENARLANEGMKRLKEFEALINTLNEKLTDTTRELEVTKDWMGELNTQINSELLGAVADAEGVLKKPMLEA